MKGTKIIAGALVSAMMLTGAGYAYWTDQVTVANTVSTGELKVEFDEVSFLGVPILPYQLNVDTAGENYINGSIEHSAKTLTVSVGNMYPGSMSLFAAKIENKGSIPAVFDEVDLDFTTDSSQLEEDLIVAGGYIHFNKNDAIKGGDFFLGTLGNLEENLNSLFNNLRLEPGDYILLDIPEEHQAEVAQAIPAYNPEEQNCIIFYLDHNAGDDAENENVQFDININWKQHNAN